MNGPALRYFYLRVHGLAPAMALKLLRLARKPAKGQGGFAWDEHEHPRADDGQFTKGQGTAPKESAETSAKPDLTDTTGGGNIPHEDAGKGPAAQEKGGREMEYDDRPHHEHVKPRLQGRAIKFVGDESLPEKFRGRTLSGGVPVQGPNGLAVKFLPLPGVSKDYMVIHVAERPALQALVDEFDASEAGEALQQRERDAAHQARVEEARRNPKPAPVDYDFTGPAYDTDEQRAAKVAAGVAERKRLDEAGAAAKRRGPLSPAERRRAEREADPEYQVSKAFDPEHDAEYPDAGKAQEKGEGRGMKREVSKEHQKAMLEAFLKKAGLEDLTVEMHGNNVRAVKVGPSPHATANSSNPNENHILVLVDKFTGRIDVKLSDGWKINAVGAPWNRKGLRQIDEVREWPEQDRLEQIARDVAGEMAPKDPYADPRSGRSPEEAENLGIN